MNTSGIASTPSQRFNSIRGSIQAAVSSVSTTTVVVNDNLGFRNNSNSGGITIEESIAPIEEDEEEQLVYGKAVMLFHDHSKKFLTFNLQKPAKQNGCVQCTLEKQPNSFSLFKFLPNDYSRRVGGKIFDSDVINIKEIKKERFFLNVAATYSSASSNASASKVLNTIDCLHAYSSWNT